MKTVTMVRLLAALAVVVTVLVVPPAASAATFSFPSATCPDDPADPNDIEDCVTGVMADGDTLVIKKGTYFEQTNDITRDVTIEGAECKKPSKTVIDATFPGPPAAGTRDYGFDIQSDGVTIRCLLIRQATHGVTGTGFDNVTLDRLEIVGATQYGVNFDGDFFRFERLSVRAGWDGFDVEGDDGRITNSLVQAGGDQGMDITGDRNRIVGNTAASSTDGDPFEIDGDDNLVDKNVAMGSDDHCFEVDGNNNVITRNTASACSNNGFDLNCTACDSMWVAGNSVTGGSGEDAGFVIRDDGGTCSAFPCVVVLNNVANDNNEEGFDIDVHFSWIQGNSASRNGAETNEHGMEVSGNENFIFRNTLTKNTWDGLFVEGDDNLIRENTTDQNGVDGVHLESGTDNWLDRNKSQKNNGDGIENDGTDTDITNNTSKKNRADCVGDGTTDVVSGNKCADGTDFTTGGTVDRPLP